MVVITVTNMTFSSDENMKTFESLYKCMLTYPGNENLKILFDLSQCTVSPPMRYIVRHGNFMIKHERDYYARISRTAIILPCISWKMLLAILFTFRAPSTPNIISLDLNEGYTFLSERN